MGGWRIFQALHPDPNDVQWVADATQHPLASALGALVPVLVLAPLIYWMGGKFAPSRWR